MVLFCAVSAFIFFIAFLKVIEWIRKNPKDIFSWLSAGILLAMVFIIIGTAIITVNSL